MSDISQRLEWINRIPLFGALDPDQRQAVAEHASVKVVGNGEWLFSHGDEAKRFFWVHKGLIKLTRLSPDGEEKVLELISSGQLFAEAIAFMEQRRYPVNAEALEETELLAIDSAHFRQLLGQSVDSCFRLLADLSMRLHHHINEIDRLTLQNATSRVIGYLLSHECGGDRVKLNTSKQVIAARLSMQPETLSRVFKKLGKEGLIKVEGQSVQLLDRDGLASFLPEGG